MAADLHSLYRRKARVLLEGNFIRALPAVGTCGFRSGLERLFAGNFSFSLHVGEPSRSRAHNRRFGIRQRPALREFRNSAPLGSPRSDLCGEGWRAPREIPADRSSVHNADDSASAFPDLGSKSTLETQASESDSISTMTRDHPSVDSHWILNRARLRTNSASKISPGPTG